MAIMLYSGSCYQIGWWCGCWCCCRRFVVWLDLLISDFSLWYNATERKSCVLRWSFFFFFHLIPVYDVCCCLVGVEWEECEGFGLASSRLKFPFEPIHHVCICVAWCAYSSSVHLFLPRGHHPARVVVVVFFLLYLFSFLLSCASALSIILYSIRNS